MKSILVQLLPRNSFNNNFSSSSCHIGITHIEKNHLTTSQAPARTQNISISRRLWDTSHCSRSFKVFYRLQNFASQTSPSFFRSCEIARSFYRRSPKSTLFQVYSLHVISQYGGRDSCLGSRHDITRWDLFDGLTVIELTMLDNRKHNHCIRALKLFSE